MCDSKKYPYLPHGRDWKFQRGGGVEDPGNSRGVGGSRAVKKFQGVRSDEKYSFRSYDENNFKHEQEKRATVTKIIRHIFFD